MGLLQNQKFIVFYYNTCCSEFDWILDEILYRCRLIHECKLIGYVWWIDKLDISNCRFGINCVSLRLFLT